MVKTASVPSAAAWWARAIPVRPPRFPTYSRKLPPAWKQAQPSDPVLRGKRWQIYQDAELNRLEEKIDVSNQNLKTVQAQFDQARALVRLSDQGSGRWL
jgi:outer membrane protein TolC